MGFDRLFDPSRNIQNLDLLMLAPQVTPTCASDVRPQLTTAKRAELDAFAHVRGSATQLLAATSGAVPFLASLILCRKLNMFKVHQATSTGLRRDEISKNVST